jgi:hypothetical protein
VAMTASKRKGARAAGLLKQVDGHLFAVGHAAPLCKAGPPEPCHVCGGRGELPCAEGGVIGKKKCLFCGGKGRDE